MSKRVVISGYYGFGNFGDEAILALLIERLKKMGLEVVVLSSNPRKTSMDYFVNSIQSFDFFQVTIPMDKGLSDFFKRRFSLCMYSGGHFVCSSSGMLSARFSGPCLTPSADYSNMKTDIC